ncbi:MAG: NAD(+)/NADH kinase [Halobacteriaceae archaeon]
MRVGIVAQRDNVAAAEVAAELEQELAVETWLDPETAELLDREGTGVDEFATCDLVISIGGDGTFLYAARHAETTPILGVNLGEVGFLNAVAPEDAVSVARREIERFRRTGTVRSQAVPRLVAESDDWTLTPAINEVVVQAHQRGRDQGIDVEIWIDDSLYDSGHADGVLVATPTGSSAYNLSEGGPLVHPGIDGLIVTTMCPTAGLRSLVVPAEATIMVRLESSEHGVAIADGSTRERVQLPGSVRISVADEPARVAGPGVDFFQALGKLAR